MEFSKDIKAQQFAGRLLGIYEYSKVKNFIPTKLAEECNYKECLNAAIKVLTELCRSGKIERKERTDIERLVNILTDSYTGFGIRDIKGLETWNNDISLNAYNKEKQLINCSLILRQALENSPLSRYELEQLFNWRCWDLYDMGTFYNKMNYLFIKAITNCAAIKSVVTLEDIKEEIDILIQIDSNCRNCWEHRELPKFTY